MTIKELVDVLRDKDSDVEVFVHLLKKDGTSEVLAIRDVSEGSSDFYIEIRATDER